MHNLNPPPDNDPMVNNIIHKLLVGSNRLQKTPASLVAGIILLAAVFVFGASSLFHDRNTAYIAAAAAVLAGFANWFSLWLLPRMGHSFGPDRPSAMALAVLNMLLLILAAPLPVWVGGILSTVLTLTAIYATWIEPFRLGVTHQQLQTSKWYQGTSLRLLHIGDIHVERITTRERKLNALVRELKPDVIVFSGDFINISYADDPRARADVRQVIGEWSAPLGVYCVPGTYTVEPLALVREFAAGLDNLRLLENEWVTLNVGDDALHILGMITTHYLDPDRTTIRTMSEKAPQGGVKLLLTHAPDIAPEADIAGYDLYVCGHTHGGQLRVPFIGAIFSGSALGMQFVMGRRDLHHLTVYTSRGVGLEGMGAPRARFFCPPEVILWEIIGTQVMLQ